MPNRLERRTEKGISNEEFKKEILSFKMVNEHYILILKDGYEVGRIFTPSGSMDDKVNSIQVCGFSEAFDFWGCAIEGFKDIQLLFDGKALGGRHSEGITIGGGCSRCYRNPCQCELPEGYAKAQAIQNMMEKYDQALYKTTENVNPFKVKREHELKDRLIYLPE